MTIVRIDTTTGNAGSNENTGFGNTVAITTTRTINVGEKIFLDCGSKNAIGPITSIDDGGIGNVFHSTLEIDAGGSNAHYEMWYCDVTTQIVSGSTITVTWTSAGGSPNLNAQIVGYTGLAIGGAEKTATNTGFSSSQSSGTTAATTTASSLVRAAYTEQTAGTTFSSVATGYTLGSTVGSAGDLTQESYKIVSSTGTQTATATVSGADTFVAGIATWPAAGGASNSATFSITQGQTMTSARSIVKLVIP